MGSDYSEQTLRHEDLVTDAPKLLLDYSKYLSEAILERSPLVGRRNSAKLGGVRPNKAKVGKRNLAVRQQSAKFGRIRPVDGWKLLQTCPVEELLKTSGVMWCDKFQHASDRFRRHLRRLSFDKLLGNSQMSRICRSCCYLQRCANSTAAPSFTRCNCWALGGNGACPVRSINVTTPRLQRSHFAV